VNKKMLRSSGVGTLVDDNGTLCDDNAGKANILNRYFASVCTADNGILPNVARVVPDSASLESVSFTAAKIMNVIKKIKPKTSCGPDGIPSLLWKKLAPYLADPLAMVFNSFMSVGEIPCEWRSAIITPLYTVSQKSSTLHLSP